MKKIALSIIFFGSFCCLTLLNTLQAQIPLTTSPSGGNKKASVSEMIGITKVSIQYDRPRVNGREGKIWGGLVPEGFADLGFGSSKAAPWRAGANENTVISFSTDVLINGNLLKAGSYGFFIAYGSDESILIFSNNHTSWGSFFYDPKDDALRLNIKPIANPISQEWLKYEFINQTENTAVVSLQWEKLKFEFKVEVDLVTTQLESFRKELKTEKGFLWQSWNQAVEFCIQKNTNLDEALVWADSATSFNFGGDRSFSAWSNKAQLFRLKNKTDEADKIMTKALPLGNMFEIHQYGKLLLSQKENSKAFEIFKYNFQRFPTEFTTLVGMARAYSANGDFKTSLKFAKEAFAKVPDPGNRMNLELMIEKLKSNKDIN